MDRSELQYARRWMALILGAMVLFFGLIFAKLFKLHILDPREPGYEAPDYETKFTLPGLRGRILDRNGNVLAETIAGRDIYVDQKDVKLKLLPPERVAELPLELAKLLGVSQEKMVDAFTGEHVINGLKRSSVKVCEVADEAILTELRERSARSVAPSNRIAGINFRDLRPIRSYPNGARLSHVIGFIDKDNNGIYGIEQRFDELLRGQNGEVVSVRDNRAREIRTRRISEKKAEHGHDVVLTIDNNIQYIIEKALAKTLEDFQAKSGIVVVQHIKSGEILGMATLPCFNPAEYRSFNASEWQNIAIARNYEPGSVMKPLTIAMALNYGLITERTPFDVGTKRIWYYAGKPLRDHATGILHAREIILQSSNIGTAMIGLRLAEPQPKLGIKHEYEFLWRAFRALGFGEKTGIELVGEQAGILPHYSKWSKLSPTRIPLGQGIAVTAIQLVSAYATIANGGVRMRPTIFRELRTHEGEVIRQNTPEVVGQPLSPKVCASVMEMMSGITDPKQHGTARRAKLRSYTVAGKTGTGQIPVNGHYNRTDFNATFIGIYPATAPELVILVTIERPQGGNREGGFVAAPTFAAVAEEIGHYLGLPADKPLPEDTP